MLFGLYKTKKERQKEEQLRKQSELEVMLKKQGELAQSLYSALSDATQENTISNIMPDGTKARDIGKIEVDMIGRNGVTVSVPDPTCYTMGSLSKRGYPVLQADIDIGKKHIHVHYGPYGSDRYYPLDSFDSVKKDLSELVKNYKFFS